MKRPTWATVVGIIGVVFGIFGILGSGQMILMPKLMEMQKGALASMQRIMQEAERQRVSMAAQTGKHAAGLPPVQQPPIIDPSKMFDKFLNYPSWFITWSLVGGIMNGIVSGFYLYSFIALLSLKKHAVSCVYVALGSAAIWTVFRSLIAFKAMGVMGASLLAGSMMSFIVHLVLLIVVATSNKAAFQSQES